MPSLPRIKRPHRRALSPDVVAAGPRIAELTSNGLTWIHVDAPRPAQAHDLAERFGWHDLDVEDVLSKRQRPKIDEYPEYLFAVLHFPRYDKQVQRLNAAELDLFLSGDYLVTLPNAELLPLTRLFRRCFIATIKTLLVSLSVPAHGRGPIQREPDRICYHRSDERAMKMRQTVFIHPDRLA